MRDCEPTELAETDFLVSVEEGVLTLRPPEGVRLIVFVDWGIPAFEDDRGRIVLNFPDFLIEEYTPELLDLDSVALVPGFTFLRSPLLTLLIERPLEGEERVDTLRVLAES